MQVTYQSAKYEPGKPFMKYVRTVKPGVLYAFCLTCPFTRRDYQQGYLGAVEVPESLRAEADKRHLYYPGYVQWKEE